MSYGTYLIKQRYIVECFSSLAVKDSENINNSHNVDQPINTTISCQNVCGPLSRCYITGEQCTSDVDCFGCMPKNVGGQNDSGKLTVGITPRY